jgi:signal transduction histidine kinase
MRLILSFVTVIILCLAVVAVAVTVSLQSIRDKYSIDQLTSMARPIYVQVLSLAKGEETWRSLLENLQEQATSNDVYILLTDKTGRIVRNISPKEENLQISQLPIEDQQKSQLPTESLMASVIKPVQGTFDAPDGRTFVYTSYYLGRLFTAQSLTNIETLTLAVPRTGTLSILAGLFGPFLRIGLIALAVSIVIAFLIARSVYLPVRKVTAAADKIAEGDYDQEVPVEGPKEIKTLAAHFNEMAGKVKESQMQLRHFVADVSHQLRTPLTSIQGFAQAILDGTAKDIEAHEKAARVIDDESKRMIKQVNELLELSRMQSGQLDLSLEPVDIKELLLHCQEVFSLRAEENGIRLITDIEPLVPVSGDEDRLEQVFSNLLDNALKNTPRQGEIVIRGRNIDNNAVELMISDSGPGIPPEQLPYVFERFYQASGLRSGFGLGLAIVREIIVRHDGEIRVQSEPGEGTQFIIILPSRSFHRKDDAS